MVLDGGLIRCSRSSGPRKDVKIIENTQIAAPNKWPKKKTAADSPVGDPSAGHRGGVEWNTVGKGGGSGRKPARSTNSVASPEVAFGVPGSNKNKVGRRTSEGTIAPAKRWTPRPAVVTITSNNNEEFSYARILSTARTKVSLKDIGIKHIKIRKAINGGLIIEIPGPEGASLANTLQEKLKVALDGMAKINRPIALSELRLTGIDPSTSADEIGRILASIGKC